MSMVYVSLSEFIIIYTRQNSVMVSFEIAIINTTISDIQDISCYGERVKIRTYIILEVL